MSTRRTRSTTQTQRVIDRGPNRALQLEEAVLVSTEIVVDTDRGESPFGWSELDTTGPDMNQPVPPRANRATRRAVAREARRKK